MNLPQRLATQQAFFRSQRPGDLLVYVNRARYPSLPGFLGPRLHAGWADRIGDPRAAAALVEEYVAQLRHALAQHPALDDDLVPCAEVYWGIGGITASMTGLEPRYAENTCWLEPHLPWDHIQSLEFRPQNRWVQFALQLNQALWRCWEQDFLILPFLHRSPLDAANGIRGTELFLEMVTAPDQVQALTAWCVDWQLAIEDFLQAEAPGTPGGGPGVWGTWLPERGVFVNGDPVGLISRPMMRQFEQPHTQRLFTATGGGFFHHHTVGIYQVDQVAETAGLLVQEFVPDPKCPNLPELLIRDPAQRARILAASRRAPIMIEGARPADLPDLLPVLRDGRFILAIAAPDDGAAEVLEQVRRQSPVR